MTAPLTYVWAFGFVGCILLFASGFGFCFGFLSWCHLHPFALYLQQFGTRTCHFAWCLLHFGMVALHFAWYLLHLAMSAFHFARYLSHFGISPLICMVFAIFWYFKRSRGSLEGSLGFHLGCHLRFHIGFRFGFFVGHHVGFYGLSKVPF